MKFIILIPLLAVSAQDFPVSDKAKEVGSPSGGSSNQTLKRKAFVTLDQPFRAMTDADCYVSITTCESGECLLDKSILKGRQVYVGLNFPGTILDDSPGVNLPFRYDFKPYSKAFAGKRVFDGLHFLVDGDEHYYYLMKFLAELQTKKESQTKAMQIAVSAPYTKKFDMGYFVDSFGANTKLFISLKDKDVTGEIGKFISTIKSKAVLVLDNEDVANKLAKYGKFEYHIAKKKARENNTFRDSIKACT